MSGLLITQNPGESEEDFNKRAREVVRQKTEGLQYNVSELKEIIQDEHIVEFPAFFIEQLDEPDFLEDFAQYLGMRKIFELHAELKQRDECMRILEMLDKKFPCGCWYFWKLEDRIIRERADDKEKVVNRSEIPNS